jgi:hypothetical protein
MCSIAAVPPFPGLRRFPHGRRFKQWTGDDSKALMKVWFQCTVPNYLSLVFAGLSPGDRGLCPKRHRQMSLSFP